MRQRTPLVVALALIVGGLAAAGTAMGHTADQTANNQYQITDQGVLTGVAGPQAACIYTSGAGLSSVQKTGIHLVELAYLLLTGDDSPADLTSACGEIREGVGSVQAVHTHAQNPTTGEPLFVPCGEQETRTQGPGGQHQHVGSCVSYAVQVKGDGGHTTQRSDIHAEVDYNRVNPTPFPEPDAPSADLDMYLYGPNGDIISAAEGADGRRIAVGGSDLPAGSYTVLLVARHGVPVGVDTGVCPTCPSVDPGHAGVGVGYDTTITVTD